MRFAQGASRGTPPSAGLDRKSGGVHRISCPRTSIEQALLPNAVSMERTASLFLRTITGRPTRAGRDRCTCGSTRTAPASTCGCNRRRTSTGPSNAFRPCARTAIVYGCDRPRTVPGTRSGRAPRNQCPSGAHPPERPCSDHRFRDGRGARRAEREWVSPRFHAARVYQYSALPRGAWAAPEPGSTQRHAVASQSNRNARNRSQEPEYADESATRGYSGFWLPAPGFFLDLLAPVFEN